MPPPRTYVARARLVADALNRSARSFIQGCAAEVGVVLVTAVYRLSLDETTVWDVNLVRSLGRVALFAAVAYAHRRYIDPSPIPSLLPPADPGRPADPPVQP